MKQPFWIDTSSLVEAHRRLFPPDSSGAFWGFLAKQINDGSICAPMQVYEELIRGGEDDRLRRFAEARTSGLCVFPKPIIQDGFRIIADHVKATYLPRRWPEFLDGGDAWVIACAMKVGGTVVCEESNSRKRKIRIPVVCSKFAVDYTDLKGMLKHFGVTFAKGRGA